MIVQIKGRPGYYFTGHGYYGGEYDIQVTISEDDFDKMLDLIDMYIDIVEALAK